MLVSLLYYMSLQQCEISSSIIIYLLEGDTKNCVVVVSNHMLCLPTLLPSTKMLDHNTAQRSSTIQTINSKMNFQYQNEKVEASDVETKEAMRRVSDLTDEYDHSEFDLCQEYENAVCCLVSCKSIIKALQEQHASKVEQIASKDEQIASKDEQIGRLEEKIIQMSLEVASTKACDDELQHRSKTPSEDSDISSESLIALASYRPMFTASNHRKSHPSSTCVSMPQITDHTQDDIDQRNKPFHSQDYCNNSTLDTKERKSLIVDFAHLRNSYVGAEL